MLPIPARRIGVLLSSLALATGCQSLGDEPPTHEHRLPAGEVAHLSELRLSQMQPYPTPSLAESAETPPAGFAPIMSQGVYRHGSRTLTTDNSIDKVRDLWDEARATDALTPLGREFGKAFKDFADVTDDVGFGDLTALGRTELWSLGQREGKRLDALFADAIAAGNKVDVKDSGKTRAEDSADEFREGLADVHPDLDIEPSQSDEDLLHFDTEDPDYRAFIKGDDWRPAYRAAIEQIDLKSHALAALRALYSDPFVDTIDNPVDEAWGLYDVYMAAPSLIADSPIDMSPFMSTENAAAFAATTDARYFYSRGPGLQGDQRSFETAQLLIDDFFKAIDEYDASTEDHQHVGVYRFAHAEEIVPLVALLQIPGTGAPLPAETVFSPETSPFAVSKVAPLAANVTWTVWRDAAETTLVSMRFNERPVAFSDRCAPYAGTDRFYEVSQLRNCTQPVTN